MNEREKAARHVLEAPTYAWAMAEILKTEPLDWQAIENVFPMLSDGERVLVRLAAYLGGRSSIGEEDTTGLPSRDIERWLDAENTRRATEAIAMLPTGLSR